MQLSTFVHRLGKILLMQISTHLRFYFTRKKERRARFVISICRVQAACFVSITQRNFSLELSLITLIAEQLKFKVYFSEAAPMHTE